jgi:hypothetical protein
LYLKVHFWIETRSLCMCARPWIQYFWYCVSVILLLKVTPRFVILFTKGMSRLFSCSTSLGGLSLLEKCCLSFPFIDLYVSAHTMISLQWGSTAVCREHKVRVSLSHKYIYHLQTEQDGFQLQQGYHLHIEFLCPVGPCDTASGWTQQKTTFLVAAILQSHSHQGRLHRKYCFQQFFYCCVYNCCYGDVNLLWNS